MGALRTVQLVIKYCQRYKEMNPDAWVWGIHERIKAQYGQSHREITNGLQIRGRDLATIGNIDLVKRHLHEEEGSAWLLLFGTIECDWESSTDRVAHGNNITQFLDRPVRSSLIEFSCMESKGSILICSSDEEFVETLLEKHEIIRTETESESKCLYILRTNCPQLSQREMSKAKQLFEELEFDPLATTQASIYFRQRKKLSNKYFITHYLEDYRLKKSTLQHSINVFQREDNIKSPISVTLHLLVDILRCLQPSAFDLLCVMVNLSQLSIPREFMPCIRLYKVSKDEDYQAVKEYILYESNQLEGNLIMLSDYNIISLEKNEYFMVNPLIRNNVLESFKGDDYFEELVGQSFVNLFLALPNEKSQSFLQWEKFYPYIRSAQERRPTHPRSLYPWALLLKRSHSFAVHVKELDVASKLLEDLQAAYNESKIKYPNAKAELALQKISQRQCKLYEKLARGKTLYEWSLSMSLTAKIKCIESVNAFQRLVEEITQTTRPEIDNGIDV